MSDLPTYAQVVPLPWPVFLKPVTIVSEEIPDSNDIPIPQYKYVITNYGDIPVLLFLLFVVEIPLMIGGIFCILNWDKEIALILPFILFSLPAMVGAFCTIVYICSEIGFIKKNYRKKVLI